MIDFLKKYWHAYKLNKGLKHFNQTGVTTPSAYSALRSMFISTRGESNDKISSEISKENGKYQFDKVSGVLGDITKDEITSMVNTMNKNGYYVFEKGQLRSFEKSN